jgi:hypothetical protein
VSPNSRLWYSCDVCGECRNLIFPPHLRWRESYTAQYSRRIRPRYFSRLGISYYCIVFFILLSPKNRDGVLILQSGYRAFYSMYAIRSISVSPQGGDKKGRGNCSICTLIFYWIKVNIRLRIRVQSDGEKAAKNIVTTHQRIRPGNFTSPEWGNFDEEFDTDGCKVYRTRVDWNSAALYVCMSCQLLCGRVYPGGIEDNQYSILTITLHLLVVQEEGKCIECTIHWTNVG